MYALILGVLGLLVFVFAASRLTLTSAIAAAVEEAELVLRFFA